MFSRKGKELKGFTESFTWFFNGFWLFFLFNFDQFCCCNRLSLFFFSSKPGIKKIKFKILSDQQQFYYEVNCNYAKSDCLIPSISHVSRPSLAADKLVLVHLDQTLCSLKAFSSTLFLKTSHRQINHIVNPPFPSEIRFPCSYFCGLTPIDQYLGGHGFRFCQGLTSQKFSLSHACLQHSENFIFNISYKYYCS